jgi:hypothetical protein
VFIELLCVAVSTVQANEALSWLRRLVAGLSPRRSWFDPRSVSVGSVVDKVALAQVSVRVLQFFLSLSFHQYSVLIFIVTLLLSEGQAGDDWEPSSKAMPLRLSENNVYESSLTSFFPRLEV